MWAQPRHLNPRVKQDKAEDLQEPFLVNEAQCRQICRHPNDPPSAYMPMKQVVDGRPILPDPPFSNDGCRDVAFCDVTGAMRPALAARMKADRRYTPEAVCRDISGIQYTERSWGYEGKSAKCRMAWHGTAWHASFGKRTEGANPMNIVSGGREVWLSVEFVWWRERGSNFKFLNFDESKVRGVDRTLGAANRRPAVGLAFGWVGLLEVCLHCIA